MQTRMCTDVLCFLSGMELSVCLSYLSEAEKVFSERVRIVTVFLSDMLELKPDLFVYYWKKRWYDTMHEPPVLLI